MKKAIALLLVVALMLGTLATLTGCAKKADSNKLTIWINGKDSYIGPSEQKLAQEDWYISQAIKRFEDAKRLWKAAVEEDTVVFSLFSPDGEEEFPGNLTVMVSYRLGEDNALLIRYFALSDRDTLCSLTNHAYFNLTGQGSGSVLEQTLRIDADRFTCIDPTILPTGEIADVAGTPLDFRAEKPIGQDIASRAYLMDAALGYDHNFVLNHPQGGVELVARAFDPAGGIGMDVLTDQPGVQLFTPYDMCSLGGKGGAVYQGRAGFCLETQHFANAMQHPHFPSIVLKAGDLYTTETIYRFTVA